MDMKDKYLGIWITRAELEDIFSARFLVAGTVVGDSPGVGLWMQLDTVSTLGDIRSAEMFEDKIELERAVGFRPT
jgi:hypothetical protein